MKLSACSVCLVALVAVAGAEDVKPVIKAYYAALDRAFVNRDIKAADATMRPRITSDFKAIAGGRTVSYQALLENFKGIFAAFPKISSSTSKVLSCVPSGNSAVVRVFSSLTASAKGPGARMHRFDLTNTSEDVWHKVGGKWKCATSTTLSETEKLDGKPFPAHKPISS